MREVGLEAGLQKGGSKYLFELGLGLRHYIFCVGGGGVKKWWWWWIWWWTKKLGV